MRIEIKTGGIIKNRDIRGMYIVAYALTHISARMVIPTLQFFADKFGYALKEKP